MTAARPESARTTEPDPPLPPGARSSLALLLAINMFNYIDRSVLFAVESQTRRELLPDDPHAHTRMGLLTTAFLFSYMLTAPVFGWLGDRWRRWAIIGIGVALWSLASGGSGLATTYALLLVTRLCVGVGEGAYGPVAPTIIADLYPVSRRGSVLAWFYVAIPVGTALGYVLGGVLGERFGWRWAFYAVAPPGLLLALWCFIRPEPARGTPDGLPHRRAGRAEYAALARTPSYVYAVLGMTAMTFAVGGVQSWMPTYIFEHRRPEGLTLERINLVMGGIVVVAGLSSTLLGGLLADRLRARVRGAYFVVSGFGMLAGFPLFLAVIWTPFPLAWAALAGGVFCIFLSTGPSNTIIANVTHPAVRATAFAFSILAIHLFGDAFSPLLIGVVADATGNMNLGFIAVSFAVLLSGLLWLRGARHLDRDTELASTPMP